MGQERSKNNTPKTKVSEMNIEIVAIPEILAPPLFPLKIKFPARMNIEKDFRIGLKMRKSSYICM